jgi:PIN domain nuclease of toxin-antitoxin system
MKKYLVDTHVVLWRAENSDKLTDNMKVALSDKSSEKYVSIASAWEIAIKLGKKNFNLEIDGGLPEFYRMIDEGGYITLSVEREHLELVPDMPLYHKDPFDRLLIATAISENMTLITGDENIHKYDVPVLW